MERVSVPAYRGAFFRFTFDVVNTNSRGYEVSVLMGEANGQGIPMGFIMQGSTDGSATENAKERALDDFLSHFSKKCPNVKFTLSDKELGEIRALRTAFPKARHISCYWHAIRTVETRLSDDAAPSAYDPRAAHRVFPWIDPTWAPGVVANGKSAFVELNSGSVRPQREEDVEEETKMAEAVSRQYLVSVAMRKLLT